MRDHELKPGDIVLARQPRQNKLSLPYDPVPYCIEKVKGPMVTAEKGGKKLTRNSSALKKVNADPMLVPMGEPVEVPSMDEEENLEELQEVPAQIEDMDIMPATTSPAPRQTRSGRHVTMPARFKDYVMQ